MVSRFNRINSRTDPANYWVKSFVKQGGFSRAPRKRLVSILKKTGVTDWQINFDFHNNPTIPAECNVDTLQRPDIVIFSGTNKIICWFELSVPLERNCLDAHARKEARYAKLKAMLELNGWTVYDFAYEIGALGFTPKSFNYMLTRLGFPNSQKKFIRKRVAKISLRSSFYIWSSRFNKSFHPPCLVRIPAKCYYPPSNSLSPGCHTQSHCPLSSTTSTAKVPDLAPPESSPVYNSSHASGSTATSSSSVLDTVLPFSSQVRNSSNLSGSIATRSSRIGTSSKSAVARQPAQCTNKDGVIPAAIMSPVPSFPNMRITLSETCSPNLKKWAHYDNWDGPDKVWFDKNIPLYQLDSLLGLDPMEHSIKSYLSDEFPSVPTTCSHFGDVALEFSNSTSSFDNASFLQSLSRLSL